MSVISQQRAFNVDRRRVGLSMHHIMVLRCHFNVGRACNRRHVPRRPIDRVSIGKESLVRFQNKRQNIHNIFVPKCQSAVTLYFIPFDSDRYFRPGFFSCLQDSETSIAIRSIVQRMAKVSYSYVFICAHTVTHI